VLSAGKRGHYYLAARALRREGVLGRFITHAFFQDGHWGRRLCSARRVAVRSEPALEGAPVVSLWPVELGYRAARAARVGRAPATRLYNHCFDVASIPWVRGAGDLFHVATTYALKSARAARRAGMRVVLDQQSVHPRYRLTTLKQVHRDLGLPPPDFDPRVGARIERELDEADRIVVPSRFVRDENVRAGIPAKRQRVVPIGVDTDLFHPAERPRPSRARLRVLFAGRLSHAKGLSVLVDAARRARVDLALAGPGERGVVPLLRAAGDRCVRLGPLSPPELARAYRDADVFCLPSFAEGSALVVYEAMAGGLPCVVTPACGSVIRHGEDGWVVPVGDANALAEAFEALADDPDLRERLGRAARRTACLHDVGAYGRRLLAAYGGIR